MKFVIRPVRKDGSQAAPERTIDADVLTLGRGADRDVLLNSTRVAWHHASIRPSPLGGCILECESAAGTVILNGSPVRNGRLNDGDEIIIGGRRMRFASRGDDYVLDIDESVIRNERSALRQKSRVTLAASGVSKRRWSWWLFVIVLLGSLLLPLGLRMSNGLQQQSQALPSDALWQPGPYSSAHRTFGNQCESCHLQLFEPVPDRACASCHKQIQHHSNDIKLMRDGRMEDYRCADCHHEHEGDAGLQLSHPRLCTDCHAQPVTRMAGSERAPVSDFLTAHPDFDVTVWGQNALRYRVELTRPLTEVTKGGDSSSLKFPHDVHLHVDGIKNAQGTNEVLECASCHAIESSRIGFKPVNFERHCQDCHRLDFDPATPGKQLSHGNVAAAQNELRGHYALKVLQDAPDPPLSKAPVRGRERSGDEARNQQRASLQAQARLGADRAIDESFRLRLCATCHELSETPKSGEAWSIMPYQQRETWFTGASFDHARHASVDCSSCHAAKGSDTSHDVLLPGITRCRDCHGGASSKLPLIQSVCVDCHGFHMSDELSMLKPDAQLHGRNVQGEILKLAPAGQLSPSPHE